MTIIRRILSDIYFNKHDVWNKLMNYGTLSLMCTLQQQQQNVVKNILVYIAPYRTVYILNISTFWNITPCNPLKISQRFGKIYRLHLDGINQARSKHYAIDFACQLFHTDFLIILFFNIEDGGDVFLRNISWLSAEYTSLSTRRHGSL
jgi:hypothetical protein